MKKTLYQAIPKKLYDFVRCEVLKQPEVITQETGIGTDYYNEWLAYRAGTIKYKNDTQKAYEWLRKRKYPLEKYKQRETTKHHLLWGKTKKRVELLDKIVDKMNSILETYSKFDIKRAKTLTQRAMVLTRGSDDLKYCLGHSKHYRDIQFTTA